MPSDDLYELADWIRTKLESRRVKQDALPGLKLDPTQRDKMFYNLNGECTGYLEVLVHLQTLGVTEAGNV